MNQKGQNTLNQRGQAALMDSIFFLTIISIVCTTLFFFAINYGSQTESQINSFYSRDFATDTLKVITYVDVIRDGRSIEEVTEGGFFENDYLLALIKEDYADKKKMSEGTTKSIVRTLDSVLKPFDASIDYAFFMVSESENEYLFLLLATHQCIPTGDDDEDGVPDCIDIDTPMYEKEINRVYFYCEPQDNTVLEKQIFPNVGKVDTALGKITLADSENQETKGRPFVIGFSGWVVQDIPQLKETYLEDPGDFNCSVVDLDFSE